MKLFFLVACVSLALLSSCAQDVKGDEELFCPQAEEEETMRVLGIGKRSADAHRNGRRTRW